VVNITKTLIGLDCTYTPPAATVAEQEEDEEAVGEKQLPRWSQTGS
jgi:hypothetical protein